VEGQRRRRGLLLIRRSPMAILFTMGFRGYREFVIACDVAKGNHSWATPECRSFRGNDRGDGPLELPPWTERPLCARRQRRSFVSDSGTGKVPFGP